MHRQAKRGKISQAIYQTVSVTSGDDEQYTTQLIEIPEYEDAVAAGSIQIIEDEEHDDQNDHDEVELDEEDDESQEIEQEGEEDIEETYNIEDNIEYTIMPKPSIASTSKSKSHYCPNCGNCYGAAGSLKLHIRACLKQKETEKRAAEARKCQICGRIYNSASYLKEHLLRHSGQGPKKCPHCPRKFMDETKYENHVQTHSTNQDVIILDGCENLNNKDEMIGTAEKKVIKEYTCSFCQKKFSVIYDTNTTKRRYACDECREKFTNEENLKRHKESLEEKKDFRCDRCGRKFVFEGFLQRHTPTCDGTIKRKRDRV